MNNKMLSLGLAAAMAVSISAPAMAAETPTLISAPNRPVVISAPVRYQYSVSMNGTPLDLARIPACDGNVPLRAIAESDFGSANWFPEEQSSSFYFGKEMISVSFKDQSITLEGKTVEGMKAQLIDGVTFVPVALLEKLDGYKVALDEKAGTCIITTKNGDAMVKTAHQIMEKMHMGKGMAADAEYMQSLNLAEKNFTQYVGFFPMMISPDTLFIGKLAEGVKAADVEKEFEAYRKNQETTFEWYLSQNLPKVLNAKFFVNGDYVMFVIGGDYLDAKNPESVLPENPVTTKDAEKIFNEFVAAQKAVK
ncbi:MAG: DUF4358 domain-containing protein [Oscillospiraceae bacterium]